MCNGIAVRFCSFEISGQTILFKFVQKSVPEFYLFIVRNTIAVFPIIFPLGRIIDDISFGFIQFMFVADNVFVVIALPMRIAGRFQ